MNPAPLDQFNDALSQIVGLPCWMGRKGYGSFLTLEFGDPQLGVREAIPEAATKSLRRRMIWVRGAWHLWIYMCRWTITEAGEEIAHSESSDHNISKAAKSLSGQILTGVEVEPQTGNTRFEFELSTLLHTYPTEADSETWLLYMADKNVLSFRGDGQYSLSPGTAPGDEVWLPTP